MTSSSPDTPGVAPRPARKRGPRPRLSQERIIEAAFRVSREGGAQALTFQAIGAELGAHPTAIYRHFRDRDDLLLALLDALHADALKTLPDITDDWAADLATLARCTYAAFQRHPEVAQHLGARTARRKHEFRKVERVVGCMLRAGFGPVDAARYYRVFSDFVLAYSVQDAALAVLDAQHREADLRAWQVDYRMLSDEEYPAINTVAHALPALDDPQNFETALGLMVDSLRLRAERVGTGAVADHSTA